MQQIFRLRTALFLACLLVSACALQAADPESKRQLEHKDYDAWNSVQASSLSPDGKWLSYSIAPAEGDSKLFIRQIDSTKEYSVLRGGSARFTYDSKKVLYTVRPDSKLIEKLRKEKSGGPMPTSHLEILDLTTGDVETIDGVNSYTLPDESGDWVAFQLSSDASKKVQSGSAALNETFQISAEGINRQPKKLEYRKPKSKPAPKSEKPAPPKKGKKKATGKKPTETKPPANKKTKPVGRMLVLRSLKTGVERRVPAVNGYRFNESGTMLTYRTSVSKNTDASEEGVFIMDLGKMTTASILSGRGEYGSAVFSKDGTQLVFLSNVDDYASEEPKWSVYHWRKGAKAAKAVLTAEAKGFPAGMVISSSSTPLFLEHGKRISLQLKPAPEKKDDKKEDDDKAVLDIWHWQDPFLQPQQKLRASAERNRTYRGIVELGKSKSRFIEIETKDIPDSSVDLRSDSNLVLLTSSRKYDKMLSWDIQGFSDWYIVDLKSGKRRMVAEKKRGRPSLSTDGNFIYWWDGEAKTWYCMSSKETDAEPIDLGASIPFPLHNELHDQPSLPSSYGLVGWTEDDKAAILYDRWDMWKVDPTGKEKAVSITNQQGRETQVAYRAVRLDREQRYIDLKQTSYLSLLDHKTKATGYAKWESKTEEEKTSFSITSLIKLDEAVGGLRKAKLSDRVIFTRSTFQRYPDLWSSTLAFKTTKRLTKANPQQDDFYWGSAELVQWKAKDGQELDGILYKPENFSPDKKYPLMVYFYERNSDNLHRYYSPAAGRSIINFSFYVSRGYVVFVPDIPYKVGEPGPSAANAILPGVDHVVEQGYIDEERIGMQGHSWGGYQTAYLVTVTNRFACAESGAPVSNMTSAYGGIRWGTGMSRMFQYEKTQSRIGGTLWEARDKYIMNSPLFAADKVETPLLILHNDKDTAVPWYQGIELFVALRRLEKPAWMLNYNDDPHWVMSDANRMDFAKRMQQFFDHYLKGDPMPVWMAEGVPAVDKGKAFGFEYVRPKK